MLAHKSGCRMVLVEKVGWNHMDIAESECQVHRMMVLGPDKLSPLIDLLLGPHHKMVAHPEEGVHHRMEAPPEEAHHKWV